MIEASSAGLVAARREACIAAVGTIVERLLGQANWSGHRCFWRSWTKGVRVGRLVYTQEDGGPYLYRGAAGIALFLCHAIDYGKPEAIERTVCGALSHALAVRLRQQGRPSFLTGDFGLAYALAVAERTFNCRIDGAEGWDLTRLPSAADFAKLGSDVMSGLAGVILGHLFLHAHALHSVDEKTLIRIGDELLRRAARSAEGFSWPSHGRFHERNLVGYAHGSAGIAHALLELSALARNDAFAEGATLALSYDLTQYDASVGGWLDYRNPALEQWLRSARSPVDVVRLRTAGEPFPHYAPRTMQAWCHGSAGLLAALVRRSELVTEENLGSVISDVATVVLRATRDMKSDCLCHGAMGNTELLRYAARARGDATYSQELDNVTSSRILQACERGWEWKSGAASFLPEPGLLMGEAGVGYALLRHMNEELPSMLVLRGSSPPRRGSSPCTPLVVSTGVVASRAPHRVAHAALPTDESKYGLGGDRRLRVGRTRRLFAWKSQHPLLGQRVLLTDAGRDALLWAVGAPPTDGAYCAAIHALDCLFAEIINSRMKLVRSPHLTGVRVVQTGRHVDLGISWDAKSASDRTPWGRSAFLWHRPEATYLLRSSLGLSRLLDSLLAQRRDHQGDAAVRIAGRPHRNRVVASRDVLLGDALRLGLLWPQVWLKEPSPSSPPNPKELIAGEEV